MAWVNIVTNNKTQYWWKDPVANPSATPVYYVFQYNSDKLTKTSIELRVLGCTSLSGQTLASSKVYTDAFHILLYPNTANHKLLRVHTQQYRAQGDNTPVPYSWACTSATFTLSKAESSSTFTMPKFWICNDGWNVIAGFNKDYSELTPTQLQAKVGDFETAYGTSGERQWFRTEVSSFGFTPTKTEANGVPTITITDQNNNTAVISGKLAKVGTFNGIKQSKLFYTTDGSSPTSANKTTIVISGLGTTSQGNYSKVVSIPAGCTQIKAQIWCESKYGSNTSKTGSASVVYHTKLKTSPTLRLVDNGNNTITYSGTVSEQGTNNPVAKTVLFYTADPAETPTRSSWTPTGVTKSIQLTPTASRTFTGTIQVTSATGEGSGMQAVVYCKPSWANDAEFNYYSTKQTLTAKYYPTPTGDVSPITLRRTAPISKITPTNIQAATWTAIPYAVGYEVTAEIIKAAGGSEPIFTNMSASTATYTFSNIDKNKIKQCVAGDKIKITIQPYSLDGKNNRLYGIKKEEIFTIENAASFNYKIMDATGHSVWKSAMPWIKVDGVWKQASNVYIKVQGEWKNSI